MCDFVRKFKIIKVSEENSHSAELDSIIGIQGNIKYKSYQKEVLDKHFFLFGKSVEEKAKRLHRKEIKCRFEKQLWR